MFTIYILVLNGYNGLEEVLPPQLQLATSIQQQGTGLLLGFTDTPKASNNIDQSFIENSSKQLSHKKLVAPGHYWLKNTEEEEAVLVHDCNINNKSEGSVIIDIDTGNIAGVFFQQRTTDQFGNNVLSLLELQPYLNDFNNS